MIVLKQKLMFDSANNFRQAWQQRRGPKIVYEEMARILTLLATYGLPRQSKGHIAVLCEPAIYIAPASLSTDQG